MSQVPISTIVNVQISRQTRGVTQAGFGTMAILTDEDSGWGGELVRTYLNLDEVLDDFASSTDAYKAAAAYFAQSPRPEELKIIAEGTRTAQVKTIVFSADLVASNVVSAFNVTAGGKIEAVTATTYAVSNANTLGLITAKLQALTAVNATDDGSHTITVTSATAGVSFSISAITVTLGASQATATIATTVANVGPADFLADASEEDDDWYGVVWNERDENLVYEMAVYIETKRKIFGTCSSDQDILDSTDTDDIAYILSAANYERTFVIFNTDPTDFADAAWMGKCFTFDPGNETWKFKTLAGITADDLTSSERAAAKDKNANVYITVGGNEITQEGVMASGEYIDVMRGTDWLQARIEERIYGRLINLPKVPFTNAGIAIIEAELRAVLENAIRESVLSGDPLDPDSDDRDLSTKPYIITVPRATDVSSNDRAERLLSGVEFEARLAGAIHKVTIDGVVTV